MAKSIDINTVRHIGRLSRIDLTDRQAAAFAAQLESILKYFDKLQELNTDNVAPMVHPVELANVLAEDIPGRSLTPREALANAPRRNGDFFKVPRVLEDS